MNVLPSTSSMRAPEARRMNSGSAPTDVNARTGLSTPPGSTCCARANRRLERVVFIVAGGDCVSAVLDCSQLADGSGDEALLVLVVRPRARRVEGSRCAVEVALEEKHRRDAERGAVRRGIALERAAKQRHRQAHVARRG